MREFITLKLFLFILLLFLFFKILYVLKLSLLLDPSLIENEDCPAGADCTYAMGDSDGGQRLRNFIESFLNKALVGSIQGRSSLIKDQKLWLFDQCSSYSYSLFLPS